MENEIWKRHPLIGTLSVSNNGRLKKDAVQKWNGHVFYTYKERVLNPVKAEKTGYMVIRVEGKTRYVHRLIVEGFFGINDKMDINHKDGNKSNNLLENLEYCTRKYNINHAFDTGLIEIGEKHHAAKYSDKIVDEVIAKYKEVGIGLKMFHELYYPDIPRTTISSFIHNHRRKRSLKRKRQ